MKKTIFGRSYALQVHDESLLDFYPGAKMAFSLRRLKSTYNGNCIRVRRSSDNEEKEFGFVNDEIDVQGISAFCGTGTGYVVAWYSQDETQRIAKQNNAGMQPYIYINGSIITDNGKPSIRFPGSQFLQVGIGGSDSGNVTLETYISCFTVNSSQQGAEFIIEHGNNANNQEGFYFYGSAGNAWIFVRTLYNPHLAGGFYWSGPSNTQILATLNYNGEGFYYKNGSLQSNNGIYGTTRPNTPLNGIFRIMCSTNGSYISNGKMQELVIYNQDEFSNRNGIETNINDHYNIY